MNRLIDFDRLVSLFTISGIGNLSIILYILIPTEIYSWIDSGRDSLMMIFILTYEWVLISLGFHYFEKKKESALKNIRNHPVRYALLVVIIGLIIYGIIAYINSRDMLKSVEKVLSLFLPLLGGLLLQVAYTSISDRLKANKNNPSAS